MIITHQENPLIIFRSKERYIRPCTSKTSNKIPVKFLKLCRKKVFFGKFHSWAALYIKKFKKKLVAKAPEKFGRQQDNKSKIK